MHLEAGPKSAVAGKQILNLVRLFPRVSGLFCAVGTLGFILPPLRNYFLPSLKVYLHQDNF